MIPVRKRQDFSRPLVPGGSNFTAMHLIFEPQSIRIKPSLWYYFFAGLLFLPVIFFLVMLLLIHSLDGGDLLFLGITALFFIFGGVLVCCAIQMILKIRKRCRSFFDLSARIFYPDGCSRQMIGQENASAVPFSEFTSLQIVEERCSTGKSSFESCELNLVVRDGRRFNLLDHSNKECLVTEAEQLSRLLSLPLTDARGDRLSTESFLALPANIRKNLSFGLTALLIVFILFVSGDGRAWYLTRQSRQWRKCPAQVEYARVREHSGRRTTYSLDFRYRYRYQGKTFTGNDYNFFSCALTSHDEIEKTVCRYPAGKRFFCFVNPRSPTLAVVNRRVPPIWEMLLNSPWSTCFLIMGIFSILKAATQYRLLKKRGKQERP